MKNFRAEGKTLNYIVGDSAVEGGSVVVAGEIAGVAVTTGQPGETIAVEVEGVFALPNGGGALTQGAKAYLKTDAEGAQTIVGTETDNTFIGYVWTAATAADTVVEVKLK